MQVRVVKYGSVHYTDTRIYARIYAVHAELGCCVSIFRQYTESVQQQSKVCIQTFALLYIAAFLCIPNCLGIMSQLITWGLRDQV